MKFVFGVGLCFLLASSTFAQHRGGGGHVGFTGSHAGNRMSYAPRHGDFVNRGFHNFYRSYWGSYWPWVYGNAGYWDSSYVDAGSSYGAPYESSPNVTVVYPPPAEPVYPTFVTITAHPVMHEYRQPEDYGLPSERSPQPVLYLIAFNDRVIRAATAYWVENDKLRYLDTDHKAKEAPLRSVDLNFSAQLNRERRVPFNLQ